MPGLGTTGPKRHFSTVGVNITAFTGLTYMWNHPGVTNPPIGAQLVYPDYVSGVLCAIIIISGVLYRDRQKRGAFIDLAQSEATAFMIGANLMEAASTGKNPEPIGNMSLSRGSPWLLSVQGRRSLVRDRRGNRAAMVGPRQHSWR